MDVTALEPKEVDEKSSALLQSVFGSVELIKLPIDLNRIVQHCDLTIKQGEFVDRDLQGALDRQSKTIFLAEKDSFQDKNFALAHELGHFKLHENVNTDIFTMHQLENLLTRQGADPKEDQADQFAAGLLMPEKLTKSLWEATNKNIESMSKIFGVPQTVVTFRLQCLKLA